MGHALIEIVSQALRTGGVRVEPAYPAGRMMALSSPAAAVRFGEVNNADRRVALLVSVMSPASGGGAACDMAAMHAADIMEPLGGICTKDVCRFDERADCFCTEVRAVFTGIATQTHWVPGPGFTLHINGYGLPHAVRFDIARKVTPGISAISAAAWEFTVEEHFPRGAAEAVELPEPFMLILTRGSVKESFAGCKWRSVTRTEEPDGLHQIRTGSVTSRTVTS